MGQSPAVSLPTLGFFLSTGRGGGWGTLGRSRGSFQRRPIPLRVDTPS